MSILDHDIISSRYFFPRRGAPPKPIWVKSGGVTLCCAAHSPHPNAPTLLYLHGNGEIVDDYFPEYAALLSSIGVNCFFAEYRGYGESTGTPALVSIKEDLAALVDATKTPHQNIIAFGRSLGSLYAIELVHQFPNIGKLVLESGICDLLERVLLRASPEELGVTPDMLEREVALHFDQEKKLSQYTGETLLLHTKNDSLVRPHHAKRNAAACRDAKLHLFSQGDHNSIFMLNQDEYLRLLQEFI
jgi:pimeloyl-ACP methyl ester carboxylesterase